MKIKDILLLCLLASIWGSSYLFIRIAAPHAGIQLTMGARVVIAAMFLLGVTFITGQFPLIRKYWWQYLVLGTFNLVLPTALVVYSVQHLNASLGSILNAATPLFTMVVAKIWLKEEITRKKVAGLLTGILGIIILVGWNPLPFDRTTLISILCSMIASVSYSFATIFSRVMFSGVNPMQTAGGQMMGGSLLALPLVVLGFKPEALTSGTILSLGILGVLCTALAYILYFKLISRIGSANISLVSILVPVFGIFWSAIFLNEPLTFGTLVGLVFIVAGLSFVLVPADKLAAIISHFRIDLTTKFWSGGVRKSCYHFQKSPYCLFCVN